MAYETIETIANTAARPTPSDGMIRYQQDIQSLIVYDSGASAWKVFTPDAVDYDLDGTNVMDNTPLFHFDASMVNGVDATENPANAQQFDTTVDSDNPTGGVWTSRSGSVVTVAQTSASLQPTYYTSGTNSKPYFAVASDILVLDPQITTNGPWTIFAVMDKTSGSSYNLTVSGDMTEIAAGASTWFHYGSNSKDYLRFAATGNVNASPPTIADGVGNGGTATTVYSELIRMFIITKGADDNIDAFFVDGNNAGAVTTNNYSLPGVLWTQLFKTKTYYHTGDFYECAVWEHKLSDADKNKLISYVNTKYDLDPSGADTGKGWNATGDDKLARPTF